MSTDTTIRRGGYWPETAKLSAPSGGTLEKLTFINKACRAVAGPATCTATMTWTAPKMTEANRQISRLNIARQFAEERSEESDDLMGLSTCMALLGQFASGPIPVPVASWTAGEGASLFLSTEGFYGDLELAGDQIEYLLKWNHNGKDFEIFDTEKVDEGRVPPRLLGWLFSAFAKHNAKVL